MPSVGRIDPISGVADPRGVGSAGREQDLDQPLGTEAAHVEHECVETLVVDFDVIDRSHQGALRVVTMRDRPFGVAAVDEMIPW